MTIANTSTTTIDKCIIVAATEAIGLVWAGAVSAVNVSCSACDIISTWCAVIESSISKSGATTKKSRDRVGILTGQSIIMKRTTTCCAIGMSYITLLSSIVSHVAIGAR